MLVDYKGAFDALNCTALGRILSVYVANDGLLCHEFVL